MIWTSFLLGMMCGLWLMPAVWLVLSLFVLLLPPQR